MSKGLQKFMKYSQEQLDEYVATEGSCVKKINTRLHISLGPYCLKNFKHYLMAHLARKKIGLYDVHLNGIILDIKNIKVVSNPANLRAEDPAIHIDLNADCYVFCPTTGAILTGTIKHIGSYNVGVVLYRVFNANIRFKDKLNADLAIDQPMNFCVKNYDLQNVFPYIDGDRITVKMENPLNKITKFKMECESDEDIENEEEVK